MSKLETTKFRRKSFPVEAVQVNIDNMKQVAQWCGGQLKTNGEKEGHLSREYIKVRVAYPISDRQTEAYLGDWVLKSGKSFKVYTNSAFEKSFDRIDVETAKTPSAPSPKQFAQKKQPVTADAG